MNAGVNLQRIGWILGQEQVTLGTMEALGQSLYWATESNLNGHSSWVNSVAFSPDSQVLASGGGDHTIHLWQRDGRAIATLQGHVDGVTGVSFNPNGRTLISGSLDGSLRLWSLTGTPLMKFEGHDAPVRTVAFSPQGDVIASGGDDAVVKLWRSDGSLIRTLVGHGDQRFKTSQRCAGQTTATPCTTFLGLTYPASTTQ